MELHYFPQSYWSRVISLVLQEKALPYEGRFVDIRRNATFDPDYLKLNPRGVVPTLVDGERTLWDSLCIAEHLDQAGGPALYTGRDDASLNELVDELESVPVMLFSYSEWVKGKRGERSADILADKIERAARYAERYPEHRALYERKRDFFTAFRDEVHDPEHVAQSIREQHDYLDDLGERVAEGGFLAGPEYSLADAIATSMLYRYVDLGLLDHWRKDQGHGLHGYYERLVGRPNFAAVFIDDPLIP